MTPLETFTATAWEQYSADPRLSATAFEGSAQRAPEDWGAFTLACQLAGSPSKRFVERAYRHYQNEMHYGKKEMQSAFVEGMRLAYAEIGGFGG